MPRSTLTQSTLFAPEELPFDQLHLRLDLWLHGPQSSLEVHRTLEDSLGHLLAYQGGMRERLLPSGLVLATEHLGTLWSDAMRRLAPF